jgi:hypothetical protein
MEVNLVGGQIAPNMHGVNNDICCRLCGGKSTEKFCLRGLQGLDVRYFECANCRSLQTQEPTWLADAYAHSNLAKADTGAAQRVLGNQAFILIAAKIFRLQTMLDFGGGDGLLCRLLRDRGLDAQTIDEHATPTYAHLFEGDLARNYDLITAFEVFEHLPRPAETLAHLFQARPRFIIASTEVYSGHDATWWYLAQGQHVFFYSRDALRLLASRHRYSYYEIHGWHVFAREPLGRGRLWAIWYLTSSKSLRLFRATLPFSETWTWIIRDAKNCR